MTVYKPVPMDKNRTPKQLHASPLRAQQRYASENASASSVITLTDNTTDIEINAVGGPAVMRWVATSDTQASVISAASGSNWDYVIPSGSYRPFPVPKETGGTTSVVGENIKFGLYRRVAIKSIGTASVLLSEY